MPSPTYTLAEVRALLTHFFDMHPRGQTGWAADNGMSVNYLNDVIAGRRTPGPGLLFVIGFETQTHVQKEFKA